MAIELDTTRELRGTSDLRKLINAVLDASTNDESRSIEWKSSLDLTTPHGCFHIARAILGFANRMPDVANAEFGGIGYILVGVEPGTVHGIDAVDNADLEPRIARYLGDGGPRWTPTELSVDNKTVLVVTVEAPREGDPIHILRKEVSPGGDIKNGVPEGTVFTRRLAATQRANAAEHDRLQARLLNRAPAPPKVSVRPLAARGEPLDWYDPSTLQAQIDEWIASQTTSLRTEALNTDRELHPDHYHEEREDPRDLSPFAYAVEMARVGAAVASVASMTKPDPRSLDEYLDELDEWAESTAETVRSEFEAMFIERARTVVWFGLDNISERNLEKVNVRVTFDWHALRAPDDAETPRGLPAPPRAYGKPVSILGDHFLHGVDGLNLAFPNLDTGPRTSWIEEGSVVAVFLIDHVYPKHESRSDPFIFVLTEPPPDGILRGRWEVRARNLDNVLSGELSIPVTRDAIDVTEILEEPEDPDTPEADINP